jgi:conjugative transposon TraN protein
MKWLCAAWIFLISNNLFSQIALPSYPLEISFDKTTNIIFPYRITSADRGSRDLLIQKAKGVENVLQVKANKQNFRTTNISVFTSDGRFFSFLVRYASDPLILNLSFINDSAVQLTKPGPTESDMDSISGMVLNQYRFLHNRVTNQDIEFSLSGIFISRHLVWLSFRLFNKGSIDFEPAYTKFFLQDKKRAKRTAIQEIGMIPINKPRLKNLPAKSDLAFVIAFKEFSIPKDKQLICLISEPEGGRILSLRIGEKTLRRAISLHP